MAEKTRVEEAVDLGLTLKYLGFQSVLRAMLLKITSQWWIAQ